MRMSRVPKGLVVAASFASCVALAALGGCSAADGAELEEVAASSVPAAELADEPAQPEPVSDPPPSPDDTPAPTDDPAVLAQVAPVENEAPPVPDEREAPTEDPPVIGEELAADDGENGAGSASADEERPDPTELAAEAID